MDNDLPLTDCCPGFGSVAKWTAVSIREAGFDVASMAATSTKVFILEVMGRHAGWTAAAGGLAAEKAGDAPQVILFPEIVFDEAKYLAAVDDSVRRYGYCAIVASEGLKNPDGQFLSEAGTKDAFGHAQLGGLAVRLAELVKAQLKLKYHYAIADYLMRAGRHIASAVDVEQSYAVGQAAVELAMSGKSGVMVTIERLQDSPYTWRTGEAPLDKVANVERKMPREFIDASGFHITEACRRYLSPLIQGEDYPPYRNGLPAYAVLKNVAVPKKTGREFKV
jgi:6-phosphofructokinase 1